MSSIINQDEIDQLLNSITINDDKDSRNELKTGCRITTCDLGQMTVFTKAQKERIKELADTAARNLCVKLSQKTGQKILIKVASVDSFKYDEFWRCCKSPSNFLVFKNQNDQPVIFESGNNPVLKEVPATLWISCLEPIFKPGNIQLNLERRETEGEYIQAMAGDAKGINITFECNINGDYFLMNLFISDAVFGKFKRNYDPEGLEIPSWENLPERNFKLDVRLGHALRSRNEILQIKEGTIIRLDKAEGEYADLFVNGKLFAKGEVAFVDDNYSLIVKELSNNCTDSPGGLV